MHKRPQPGYEFSRVSRAKYRQFVTRSLRVLHNPRQPLPRRVLMRKKLVNFVDVRGRQAMLRGIH